MVKEHKSCFLLAQTADDLEKFRETLQEKFPDLVIAGAYAAEDAGEEPEVIVNEINGILPDVIFSTLDQPFQELFLHEQRAKMGARVWFGFGPMGSGGRFGEEKTKRNTRRRWRKKRQKSCLQKKTERQALRNKALTVHTRHSQNIKNM